MIGTPTLKLEHLGESLEYSEGGTYIVQFQDTNDFMPERGFSDQWFEKYSEALSLFLKSSEEIINKTAKFNMVSLCQQPDSKTWMLIDVFYDHSYNPNNR